ncbi:unnamed protein product [Spirodela intermedia]|uniref:Uncharacterized protein n=1 Tax=Spirodela intermedia TaxID=51605 RepID=A0ABN7EBI8_SPIIN|nr:unnamed protein product [Spirodela intermedia]
MEEAKETGLRKTGEGQRGDRKDKEPVTGRQLFTNTVNFFLYFLQHVLDLIDLELYILLIIGSISTREKCSWTQRHASANMEKLFSVSASPRSPRLTWWALLDEFWSPLQLPQ